MRRVCILLFCILLAGLIASPCPGEEGSKFEVDGRKWDSWNEVMKLGWVMGFGDGIHQADRETLFLLVYLTGAINVKYGITS